VDVDREIPETLGAHPAIEEVWLIGSRANGRAHELSDWDFAVETDDFESVARDLHRLVAPFRPLAEQWDPYSFHACYMLMLPGPIKIDLFFPAEPRSWSPAWEPSPTTLQAIDSHFWDWILWLEQKRSGGYANVLRKGLRDMYELMLRPMGVTGEPTSVPDATRAYLEARGELEQRFGVSVDRDLEADVRPAVLRGRRADAPD
jgi:hypothetical protein